MTVKEQIVEALRSDGYDFVSACEEASRVIAEFLASGKKQEVYHTKRTSLTLRRS